MRTKILSSFPWALFQNFGHMTPSCHPRVHLSISGKLRTGTWGRGRIICKSWFRKNFQLLTQQSPPVLARKTQKKHVKAQHEYFDKIFKKHWKPNMNDLITLSNVLHITQQSLFVLNKKTLETIHAESWGTEFSSNELDSLSPTQTKLNYCD